MELSGLGKLAAVVVVLIIGIDVYSRWTGQSFGPVNLLGGPGGNALGADIKAAAVTWSPGAVTSGGALAGFTPSAGAAATFAALPVPPAGGATAGPALLA